MSQRSYSIIALHGATKHAFNGRRPDNRGSPPHLLHSPIAVGVLVSLYPHLNSKFYVIIFCFAQPTLFVHLLTFVSFISVVNPPKAGICVVSIAVCISVWFVCVLPCRVMD